jgi:hypothetical protein
MTTLGLLILFNSGTSLSVIQPEVKRISLIVTILFTSVFPASMIIILYLTKVISDIRFHDKNARVLPLSLAIILYMFTFFIMRGIPQLSGGHIAFLFCPPAALFVALVLNNFMKPSIHMLGIGMLVGILLVLIVFYGAPIQLLFIVVVLASGLLGTARLVLQAHTPREVVVGFTAGFLVSGIIITIFIL